MVAGMGGNDVPVQAWARSSRFWCESKMPVRVLGSFGCFGGQIMPVARTMGLSPHGQTWLGSVICVKNGMLSLKDWRRSLEVGKLAGDWQVFLKCRNMQRLAIICFGGQVCQAKVSHCWKDFLERRSRKVFGRHGPRCRAKVDLLCSGNGVHCFSLFLQVL